MIDERGRVLGAHSPLIRHCFLGVFRFARTARADVRDLTHDNMRIRSYKQPRSDLIIT